MNPFRGEEYSPGSPPRSVRLRSPSIWPRPVIDPIGIPETGSWQKLEFCKQLSMWVPWCNHRKQSPILHCYTPSIATQMLDAKVLKYLNLNWLKSPTPIVDGRAIMWWEQTDHHHDQVNQLLWCLLHLVSLAAYKDHEFYVFCWLKDFPSLLTCLICWTVAMAN